MVYIILWDDFVEKSIQLFRANPEKTRYVMKYRHCDGKLVLKVTDDKELEKRFEKRHVPPFLAKLQAYSCPNATPYVIYNLGYICRCLKFKTDQAQDAKKMEKLNNIFFTLMARGPETDITEVTGKEQIAQPAKRGRGRKQ